MKGALMYHMVHELKVHGKSIRAISKELGIHRVTVRKLLKKDPDEAREYFAFKVIRHSEFDQYFEYITDNLTRYPRITLTRLYEKLKDEYPEIKASARAFRAYMQKKDLRSKFTDSRKRHYEPVVNYIPGNLIQVDLGELNVPYYNSKKTFKVYFVCFVVCWSRYMYVTFSTSPYNTEKFIEAHNEAFEYFGAIPSEMLYDQTKLVVINEEYRELTLNNAFGKYALNKGFSISACEGYDPESKGMVEKSVSFVKSSFLIGREFLGIDDLQKQSKEWLQKANNRIHGTTKLIPSEQFKIEKESMTLFKGSMAATEYRIADKTSLISYKGLKYSIPTIYQNKKVRIKELDQSLHVYELETTKLITKWDLSKHNEPVNKNFNHYRDYRESIEEIKQRVIDKLPLSGINDTDQFMDKLLKTCYKNIRDQYRGLEKLMRKYDKELWTQSALAISSMPKISCKRIESLFKELKKKSIIEQKKEEAKNKCLETAKDEFRNIKQYDAYATDEVK